MPIRIRKPSGRRTITLKPAVHERLMAYCNNRGISASGAVEEALKKLMEQWKPGADHPWRKFELPKPQPERGERRGACRWRG